MNTHRKLLTLADTSAFAEKLINSLEPGMILALSGPVGAGKTTFVKALGAALGVSETIVSPTFTLMQPYELPRAIRGIETLVHIDAYRLESADELAAIGAEDFFNDSSCLVVIEWAEKIASLLAGRPILWLTFEIIGEHHVCTTEKK